MRFRNFDSLRIFNIVAHHDSFSAAANELNLTKGAVSHQIRQLESELGFTVFDRLPRGIALNAKGRELMKISQSAFQNIEQHIDAQRQENSRALTIGVSTYFASRWLSPKLMDFMRSHPDIRLRIQPMIDLLDLKNEGVDLAIRWGDGSWKDCTVEPLFSCPAWPCGNQDAFEQTRIKGLEGAFADFTLLRDRDDSNAWSHWYSVASLPYQARADTLIIPDPNVRVQAVIDGQGVALNDDLIAPEIAAKRLYRLSETELSNYGYFLAYPGKKALSADVDALIGWLKSRF